MLRIGYNQSGGRVKSPAMERLMRKKRPIWNNRPAAECVALILLRKLCCVSELLLRKAL